MGICTCVYSGTGRSRFTALIHFTFANPHFQIPFIFLLTNQTTPVHLFDQELYYNYNGKVRVGPSPNIFYRTL